MSARILLGKEFAQRIAEETQREADILAAHYGRRPGLAVVLVGDNPASKVYIRGKEKACAALNFRSQLVALPEAATKANVIEAIEALNASDDIDGILVQLPLPPALMKDEAEILSHVSPRKDVDGFHPVNVGKLFLGQKGLVPCTPMGCLRMLEMAGIKIDGQRAVVVGRSNIVGKPMAQLLLQRNATVTICHSHTQELASLTREADILVVAMGRPHFVTADMVKSGATVIDVGINRVAPKKLLGDVDFDNVKEIAGAITPVPGGVGLLTVAMLMQNTAHAMRLRKEH